MRLISFTRNGRAGVGVEIDGAVRGYSEGEAGFPGTLDQLVRAGALADAGRALQGAPELSREGLAYRPPLARPGKIVCIGLNYVDHSLEAGFTPPDYPAVFARFATTLVGHEQPIVRPAVSIQLDYEGELAVVIGRTGRSIARGQALDHVAAYSVFNDASVRDYQFKGGQWTMGKNFDATGGFGPALVTPDELPAAAAGLAIATRLNGQVVQSASTAAMVFDVPSLIELLSEAMTLEPGDVIVTGTPAGIGHARKPPLYMAPGDVCEVEIEGVGLLRNRIVQQEG